MRLLYVTEGVPTRDALSGDGSSMISYELIRRLPPEVRVTLVTFGADSPLPPEIESRCVAVHRLPMRGFWTMAARSVLIGGSLGTLQRGGRSTVALVDRLSRDADATLLHGPHVAFLAPVVQGPVVLQVVDPWSSRATLEAAAATGLLRRYRSRQARQSLEMERALPPTARLLTVGRNDAESWERSLHRPVGNIANGVDVHEGVAARSSDSPPSACFVGSLNYPPNVESVQILIRDVAPEVWRVRPDTKFVIAGRHPTPAVLALAGASVEVRGNVPSVLQIFAEADVAVFPDQQGLGVRNSVSEALAAGLPVVATPTAAREQPDHPDLHIVDGVPAIVDALLAALDRPRRTAGQGRDRALRTWDTAMQDYLDELVRVIEEHPRSVG